MRPKALMTLNEVSLLSILLYSPLRSLRLSGKNVFTPKC